MGDLQNLERLIGRTCGNTLMGERVVQALIANPEAFVAALVQVGKLEPKAWECSLKDAGRWTNEAECCLGGEHTPISFRLVPSTGEEVPADG